MDEHATYFVSLKVLLRRGDEGLFLRCGKKHWCNNAPHWDWPGGRINRSENSTPVSKIIKREVAEELGKNIKYKLKSPAFHFRRNHPHKENWIFVIVHEADYISGDIKISNEHSGYEWINLRKAKLNRNDFCNDEMYQMTVQYLNLVKKFKNHLHQL